MSMKCLHCGQSDTADYVRGTCLLPTDDDRHKYVPEQPESQHEREVGELKEQVKKGDGLAREINILTKENRALSRQVRVQQEVIDGYVYAKENGIDINAETGEVK